MNRAIKNILILGGASAGWLTAGVIAAEHGEGLNNTLIESPDASITGVGDGIWSSMRKTLRKMGMSGSASMLECDASLKQGSKFIGLNTGGKSDSCYHPLSLLQAFFEVNNRQLLGRMSQCA